MTGKFFDTLGRTFFQTAEELLGLVVMFAIWTAGVTTLGALPALGTIGLVGVIGLVVFFIEGGLDRVARGLGFFEGVLDGLGVVVTETVIWLVAFSVFELFRPGGEFLAATIAGVVLVVAMTLQHTWENNLAHGRSMFDEFVDPEMIPHSVLEGVIAGGLWIYIASGAAMLSGLTMFVVAVVVLYLGIGPEHVLGFRLAGGRR